MLLDFLSLPRITEDLLLHKLMFPNGTYPVVGYWLIPSSTKLTGAEEILELMCSGRITVTNGGPMLQEIKLEWITVGKIRHHLPSRSTLKILEQIYTQLNSDERIGLSFTIGAWPCQRSHSQVRVPRDSWPHFTPSDSRLPQPGGIGSLELHNDNAPAKTGLSVQEFLAKKCIPVFPQAPYSPDLSSCHFYLFPKLKSKDKTYIEFCKVL
jgi:hypothetical protein